MAEHREPDGGTLSERYDELLESMGETLAKASGLLRINAVALDALTEIATGRCAEPDGRALDALRDIHALGGERL